MTSPVDTSVKHYRSDMPGAPVVNGLSGTRIAQLKACLCTGYGLRTADTLKVLDGVATLTFSGGTNPAWPNAVILVEGSSIAALNGEQRVVASSATTVTFSTAQPNATASGTLTFKIAPAGWEEVYSKTNVSVFRSLHAESRKMLLRVDDTFGTYSKVVGYLSMSGVDTGTNPFPSKAQSTGGGAWSKSYAANATPAQWLLAADAMLFYDVTTPQSVQGSQYQNSVLRGFGEPVAYSSLGDAYLTVLCCSVGQTSAVGMFDGQFSSNDSTGVYVARSADGLTPSISLLSRPYSGTPGSGASGDHTAFGDFPHPLDGALRFAEMFLAEGAMDRCLLPGIYFCLQKKVWASIKAYDTVPHQDIRLLATSSGVTNGGSTESSDTMTGVTLLDVTRAWR